MAFSKETSAYIVFFAVVTCLVCSLAVSALAVSLKEKQDFNKKIDKYENLLRVSGLIGPDEKRPAAEVEQLFKDKLRMILVNRKTGEVIENPDGAEYDPIKAAKDPDLSESATSGLAKRANVKRLPNTVQVYECTEPGKESYIFLIYGNGLWSTLYGYVCVKTDCQTITGITYYDHKETPGLGGEVDNRAWKNLWPGKKIYGEDGNPKIEVVKTGATGDFQVDGLAGATITSNGVTFMLQLWLGDEGYKAFMDRVRKS